MKISACLIVKGTDEEAAYLDKCLASFADHVDEICLTISHLPGEKPNKAVHAVGAKYGARMKDYEWIDDFADARNTNFAQATGDFIFWCDADDIVERADKIRPILENTPPHISTIGLNYDYEVADNGNVKAKHIRERLIRNDGSLIWKGRLHETPIETRRSAKAKTTEINIVHTSKPDRWDAAAERNIRILSAQLADEGSDPDPRTLYYLATAHKSRGDLESAQTLLEMYLKLSGWDEERCMAWCALAEIHLAYERDADATDCYFHAIKEREDMPLPYIGLGEIYAVAGNYQKAINWLDMALSKPEPSTNMVISPLMYTYRPLVVMAECLFAEGKLDKAISALKQAQSYNDDEPIQALLKFYNTVKGHKLATESVTGLAKFLELNNQKDKVASLIEAIPDELQDNPLILKLKKNYTEPKTWGKSVVIFTGSSVLGEWGPWSLEDGIGGSEEAIIRLSRRLLEQGYPVTVYATPGARASEYDGITWKNYWELDTRDTFDVFVAWRSPWFFDAKIKARKKYLWLHDVMEAGEFTPERLAELDKVIVLSEYHRSLFPDIPDDKIFLSANGIDAEELVVNGQNGPISTESMREPHTVVYQSSHVRGLAHIYDVWPEVLKAVPDAKLRIMYGWESFIAVHRGNPERMEWMEGMKQRAEKLGVLDLGKVSHARCVEELLSAGVWAYPCPFPEISCITAMKAQAAGAVPVASNYAALNETIQFGVKQEMDEWNDETREAYKTALIDMLQDTDKQAAIRAEMMPAARKLFSWTNVAKQWIAEFK